MAHNLYDNFLFNQKTEVAKLSATRDQMDDKQRQLEDMTLRLQQKISNSSGVYKIYSVVLCTFNSLVGHHANVMGTMLSCSCQD